MSEEVQNYIIEKCNADVLILFSKVRNLVIKSVPNEIDEKLYAKLPSYYLGDRYIRIIPFKDHINIEAKAVMMYREQLKQYKLTPKGMLQLFINQDIPESVLSQIFCSTLTE